LEDEKLTKPVIADVILHNIDAANDEIGTLDIDTIRLDVSPENIQREFDYLAKRWSLPYTPSRSYSKIKSALYNWFFQFGYKKGAVLVQKIVVCSENKQQFFSEAVITAQERYEAIRTREIAEKRQKSKMLFSLPLFDDYSDNYELLKNIKRNPYDKCYLVISNNPWLMDKII
jgi:hypothetical protein